RFQSKTDKERQRGTVYNDKRDSPPRRHNTYKYIRTQHRSTKICKATLNRTKRRHQQQYNNSRGPQHTINTNGQNIRQKINKEIIEVNEKLDQMDLIDIYRTLHPKTAGYTFFSSAHGTFSRIDHILGTKANINKYK
uniref:Uncharacterized protein n=1 Tax=Equus caballus TaxID=9796 RepID=A0A9L0RPK1_HORSE